MALTSAQRKALEAAGYTVGKSGKTVQDKNGGTVGGINENGKFFSGSKKVMGILKAKPEEVKEAPVKKERAAPKKEAKKASSPRPKAKPEPKTKTYSGRGDGASETARRKEDSKKKANSASIPAAAPAAALAARKRPADKAKAFNPSFTGKASSKEGFQGKFNTTVGRPRSARGVGSLDNPGKFMKRLGGGRLNSLDPRNNPFRLE